MYCIYGGSTRTSKSLGKSVFKIDNAFLNYIAIATTITILATTKVQPLCSDYVQNQLTSSAIHWGHAGPLTTTATQGAWFKTDTDCNWNGTSTMQARE
jgi:hypothetical protein